MLKSKIAAALLVGLSIAAPAQATVVSYYLDQSNKLADGINYLQVTISDEGDPGVINFTVQALPALLALAGENFGIKKFGFNVLGGVGAEAEDVTNLPDHWRARNGGRMDGFGLFDITLKSSRSAGSSNVQDPLTFSLAGVDFDTVVSYVDLSTGRSPQGFSLFSAEVTGLLNCDFREITQSDDGDNCCDGGGNKRAYFGGNTSAVPAPPAVWLLGTGLLGLVARRFRATKSAA